MLIVVIFSLLCIFFNTVCMYDFMLNVWSLRERENEFQLFLFLSERISCKECSETSVRCALTKIQSSSLKSQDGYRCSHFNRSASEAKKPCKVYANWLKVRTYQLRERFEDCCCRRCTELRNQICRGIWRSVARSACRNLLEVDFVSGSSWGITPLNTSKEDKD